MTVLSHPTMASGVKKAITKTSLITSNVNYIEILIFDFYAFVERGATFQGESFIRRRFTNPKDSIKDVEARFGFSSTYAGEETVLLTVQIPGQNYSLLFAINAEGHLILRETVGPVTEGATVKYQHFVDGSRHSVYYMRDSEETILIIDQEEIPVVLLDSKTKFNFKLIPNQNLNVGEIFVAGVNEAVPELVNFKRFKGCLSSKSQIFF